MIERARIETRLGFEAHPHMLRHACGYALANKGVNAGTKLRQRAWVKMHHGGWQIGFCG